MKIEILKPNRALLITETINGKVYQQRYMGYSEKQAIKEFEKFVKNKR